MVGVPTVIQPFRLINRYPPWLTMTITTIHQNRRVWRRYADYGYTSACCPKKIACGYPSIVLQTFNGPAGTQTWLDTKWEVNFRILSLGFSLEKLAHSQKNEGIKLVEQTLNFVWYVGNPREQQAPARGGSTFQWSDSWDLLGLPSLENSNGRSVLINHPLFIHK